MPNKKEFIQTLVIHTLPENIWRVWMAVDEWPLWTDTILSIKKLSPGSLQTDSRVLIEQPKLAKAVWKITKFEPVKQFTWSKTNLLLRIDAIHALELTSDGCIVTLVIKFSGLFANLINKKTCALVDSYLVRESQNLKQFCENKFSNVAAS